MKKIFIYIRLNDWWNFIVPPVMTFYYLGLLTTTTIDTPLSSITLRTLIFLLLTVFVAALGFFLNEWTDIKDDRVSDKKNSLAELPRYKIHLIFLFLSAGVLLPSLLIKWNRYSLLLLIIQLFLFLLYSVFPFRLKRNKYAAIIIDALYSGTIFYFIAFITGAYSSAIHFPLCFILFSWAFCKGIRNILYHLIQDRNHDILLPAPTIATTNSIVQLKNIIKFILLPTEIISYLAMLYLLPFHFIFISFYLLFISYVYFRKEYFIPFILKRKNALKHDIITDINLFYEIIMPFLTLGILVYRDPRIMLLFCLSLILFPQVIIWVKHVYIEILKKKPD